MDKTILLLYRDKNGHNWKFFDTKNEALDWIKGKDLKIIEFFSFSVSEDFWDTKEQEEK